MSVDFKGSKTFTDHDLVGPTGANVRVSSIHLIGLSSAACSATLCAGVSLTGAATQTVIIDAPISEGAAISSHNSDCIDVRFEGGCGLYTGANFGAVTITFATEP